MVEHLPPNLYQRPELAYFLSHGSSSCKPCSNRIFKFILIETVMAIRLPSSPIWVGLIVADFRRWLLISTSNSLCASFYSLNQMMLGGPLMMSRGIWEIQNGLKKWLFNLRWLGNYRADFFSLVCYASGLTCSRPRPTQP